jgi:hypothetical protein
MDTKKCPTCNEQFDANHGNRIFCSDVCYEQNKRRKQKENNALMKQCRLGFLRNYQYLRELLPDAGNLSIALLKLLKKGFDQDAYYGTRIDVKGEHWHSINEYMFNICKTDGQLILNLYKS